MALARLIVLLLLTGCAAEPESPPRWLAERLVWCYRTLADPDCYRRRSPVPSTA
ncbi:MAG TPA: hypothetical protein VLE23_01310 [Geminicoccaceae bacterium]|nr:hypothetical protein [Geminicoccaceae bacterium]